MDDMRERADVLGQDRFSCRSPLDKITEELAREHEALWRAENVGDPIHRVESVTGVADASESFACSCGKLFTQKHAQAELERRIRCLEQEIAAAEQRQAEKIRRSETVLRLAVAEGVDRPAVDRLLQQIADEP